MGLGLTKKAGKTEIGAAHRLGKGAFNAGLVAIEELEGRRLLLWASGLQGLKLGLRQNAQTAGASDRTGTAGPEGAAYLTEDVKWRATNWLRNDLAAHCMALDMRFHNEHTPGSMSERIDGDITELSNFFSQFVLRVLANLLLLVGVLFMLYQQEWHIGGVFTLFTLFSIIVFVVMVSMVRYGARFWGEEREASSQLFGGLEEWLAGTEDIRASGGVPYMLDRMQRFTSRLYRAARKAFFVGNLTWGLAGFMFTINLVLALGLGAYLFQTGVITLGTVYLIMSYSNTLQRPVIQLARQFQEMQAAAASIERVRELFAIQPQVQSPADAWVLPAGPLLVAFDHVNFGYNATDLILRDVDFRLEAGKVLGLLGRTGSGKTTITRLLFQLYDVTDGAICLGDQDLRQVTLDNLRGAVTDLWPVPGTLAAPARDFAHSF
jgi:ABC-type multidrug transport system fused ATPase/permease subunit